MVKNIGINKTLTNTILIKDDFPLNRNKKTMCMLFPKTNKGKIKIKIKKKANTIFPFCVKHHRVP